MKNMSLDYCRKRRRYAEFLPLQSPIEEIDEVILDKKKIEIMTATTEMTYVNNPFNKDEIRGLAADVLADGLSQEVLGSYSMKRSAEFIAADVIYQAFVKGLINNISSHPTLTNNLWKSDMIDDDIQESIAKFVTWSVVEYLEGKLFGGLGSITNIMKRNGLTAGIVLVAKKTLPFLG